jgi:hypothetical protein
MVASVARKDLESWKNVTLGPVFVRRLDHRGELNKVEEVPGGRTFHLTPEERRINSEQAADEDLDFFRNGQMQPVRLLDDSDEARELSSNPNLLSETDMRELVHVHAKTFEMRIKAIRNPTTLQRLMVIARDEDATIKRVEMITARLSELSPNMPAMTTSMGPRPAPRSSYGKPTTPR